MVWGCQDTDLVHYILEGIRAIDCEADEEQVRLWVGERTQTIVFLLSRGIPQCKLDRFAGRFVVGMGDVVLEDCGNIFLVTRLALIVPSTHYSPGLTSGKIP